MAWFTHSSRLTLLATILTLGLAVNVPGRVQAQLESSSLSLQLPNRWENVSFSPPSSPNPNQPIPINRDTGGRRDTCIAQRDGLLTALVPASGIGTTIADYPTVVWYIPRTTAWGVEFTLRDSKNQEIYSTKHAFDHYTGTTASGYSEQFVVGTPGLMSLKLPASSGLPPLKIGEEYRWQLRLICDAIDRSGDYYVDGGFKRMEPDSTLARRLQQANSQQQVAIYADQRLWYETLNTLIELRRTNPNDRNLTDAWNKLLKSVGLDKIAEEPLFQDSRTPRNIQ